MLAPVFVPAMQSVIRAGLLDSFDVVLTEMMVVGELKLIMMLKGMFDRSVVPGRPLSFSLSFGWSY